MLDEAASYTQHKECKRKVRLHKKDSVFAMRMEVMPSTTP